MSVFLCVVMLAVSVVPVFAEDVSGGPALGITSGARYTLRNKSSSKYLTLPGYTDTAKNVYQDGINGNDQYSRIVEVNYHQGEGKYTIMPHIYGYFEGGYLVSRSGNVEVATTQNGNGKWVIEYVADKGGYKITDSEGKAVTAVGYSAGSIRNDGLTEEGNIIVSEYTGDTRQIWVFETSNTYPNPHIFKPNVVTKKNLGCGQEWIFKLSDSEMSNPNLKVTSYNVSNTEMLTVCQNGKYFVVKINEDTQNEDRTDNFAVMEIRLNNGDERTVVIQNSGSGSGCNDSCSTLAFEADFKLYSVTVDQDSDAYRILTFRSGIGVGGSEVNNVYTWEISDTSCVEMAAYENKHLAGYNFVVVKPKKAGFAVITAITDNGDEYFMAIEVKEKTSSGEIISKNNIVYREYEFEDYQYVSAKRNENYLIIMPEDMGAVEEWTFDDIVEVDENKKDISTVQYGYDYSFDNAEYVITGEKFAVLTIKNKLCDVALLIRTVDLQDTHQKIAFNVSHEVTEILPDGTYFIQNMYNGKYIQLDDVADQTQNGLNTETWSFDGAMDQMWNLRWLGNGYYRILSAKTGQALSIDSDKVTNDDAMVVLADVNCNIATSANQQWMFELTENGTYRIINKATLMANDDLQMALAFGFTQGLDGTNVANRRAVFDNKDEWRLRNTVISGVPCEVYSTEEHLCIPTALAHIVGYWDKTLTEYDITFSEYGLVANMSLEELATKIHNEMPDPWANDSIAIVLDKFRLVRIENQITTWYEFSMTQFEFLNQEYWLGNLSKEIMNDRPTTFAFIGVEEAHVGVCMGIEVVDGEIYVYVCNAWEKFYKRIKILSNYNLGYRCFEIVEVGAGE